MGRKGQNRRRASSDSSGSSDAGADGAAGGGRAFQPPQRGAGGQRRRKAGRGGEAAEEAASGGCGGGGARAPTATDVRAMTSLALRCHHGRHVTADASGDLKASSAIVRDAEKFEVTAHDDGAISLRTCHGKYIGVDKGGELKALRDVVGDAERFSLVAHADGTISLGTSRGYVAAEQKCGLRANRGMIGAWEKFVPKDRSRTKSQQASDCAEASQASAPAAAPPLFDAFCELQAVLTAEEAYAQARADKTAIAFGKRARQRREQGLAHCFRHFRDDQGGYGPSFLGCVSGWDATVVRLPDECEGAVEGDGESDCTAVAAMLAQGVEEGSAEVGPLVHAAFGIPAASAAEAGDAALERLERLLRWPQCVAVGPVGLNMQDVAEAAEPKDPRHRGLSAAGVVAEFGVPPSSAYDAARDPACVAWMAAGGSRVEDWVMRHGDRRAGEFATAGADYERRRSAAQVGVAERQIRLAKDLDLPLIVQLPPQAEAERRMAELLVAGLGGPGCQHPVLLSGFQGRPKCVAALLQHFPNLCVGFSGLLTHSKLQDSLGEVAFDTPMGNVVLESLGPRYPPAGAAGAGGRGTFSHPAHVAAVAAELAKVKRVDEEAVLRASLENAKRLYRLPRRRPEAAAGAGGEDAAPEADAEAPAEDDSGSEAVLRVPTRERLKGKSPFLRPKDLAALFKEIDADGDDVLGEEDLLAYLGDYLGYGRAEIECFRVTHGAGTARAGGAGVEFDEFKKNFQELNAYCIRDRIGRTLVRQPGAFGGISGVDFHLEDSSDCEIWICDRAAEFFVDNVTDSRVLVGPCTSSTFIRNCSRCTFWVATRQFRTRDCTDCTFYLHSHTEPIIESSRGLVFAPYAAAYPGLTAQFQEAKFDATRNFWSAIYDFSGKAGRANWRIRPLDECEVLEVHFDGRPDLLPDSPAPPLTQELLTAPPPHSEEGSGHSVAAIPQTRPPPPPAPKGGGPRRLWVSDAEDPAPRRPRESGRPAESSSDAEEDDDEISVADSDGK